MVAARTDPRESYSGWKSVLKCANMMTRQEALAVLGLADTASSDDIQAAVRDSLFRVHPDRGGDERAFSVVLDARDALAKTPGDEPMMLVPIDHGRAMLERVERREIVENRRRHSDAVTRQLVRAEVTRIKRTRRTANLLAFVGGGATAVGIALSATHSRVDVLPWGSHLWPSWLTVTFAVVGAICAGASYLVSGQIDAIENAIEDASETLTDRSAFVDAIHELAEASSQESDSLARPLT